MWKTLLIGSLETCTVFHWRTKTLLTGFITLLLNISTYYKDSVVSDSVVCIYKDSLVSPPPPVVNVSGLEVIFSPAALLSVSTSNGYWNKAKRLIRLFLPPRVLY